MKAPFPYFGGKSVVAPLVWERLGDVPNYVEPFFGSGACLLARPHDAGIETVNDADGFVSNFWRSIQKEPEAVAAWADWPVSEPDLHARHLWLVNEGRARAERLTWDPDFYDVKVAGWWVWGACQWIGGGWCSGKGPWKGEGRGAGDPRTMPYLRSEGCGIHSAGVKRQMPDLAGGRGVFRRAPEFGVKRQMPSLSGSGMGEIRPSRREQVAAWLQLLAERLRDVRVCCGDWSRVVGPTPTFHNGLTGVFLDPPYAVSEREERCYAVETDCSAAVREWAIANGDNPLLRIALCGYEGEHQMPESWECVPWKARGGYGSQGEGRGRENAARERIWFSPHCLKPSRQRVQMALFAEVPA